MSDDRPIDYDSLAHGYDGRYAVDPLDGVEAALGALVTDEEPERVLEIGCGTGRWLATLARGSVQTVGMDPSTGMLAAAHEKRTSAQLLAADADALPFGRHAFDLIAAINAAHHFGDPASVLRCCADSLRTGGLLALVHYDPSRPGQFWYIYDDFDGALEGDLARFPSEEQLAEWMDGAGLHSIGSEVIETIERRYSGRAVLDDFFLGRHSSSTLARLTDTNYEHGLESLRRRIDQAEARDQTPEFTVRLLLLLVTGRKP